MNSSRLTFAFAQHKKGARDRLRSRDIFGSRKGPRFWRLTVIRHIVFFSAKRPEDVETIHEGLKTLGTIPHSQFFEVSLNSKVDPYGNDVDVVVYAEFADEDALAAYKAHPTYAETTARVRPMREMRYSADFRAS